LARAGGEGLHKLCLVLGLAVIAVATPALAGPCDRTAADLFAQRGLAGLLVAQDVRTGAVVAESGAQSPILPLSTVKLLAFAAYLEHRAQLPADLKVDPEALIAQGVDGDGRRLGIALRHGLDDAALLRQLAVFGFPPCRPGQAADCISITSADSDQRWGDLLSIGEADIRVTPLGLSRFLRAVGRGGLGDAAAPRRIMRAATARQLQAAMLRTVQVGTAASIKDRLAGLGQIGGKTGSGPANANPLDGVFAALVFDRRGAARYTVVTYVRAGGYGGGAAAAISADLAAKLLRTGAYSSSASSAKLASQCSPM
jgi:hypothetical protein